ncbi:MAG: LemA family protein [Terriglobia bacterium]
MEIIIAIIVIVVVLVVIAVLVLRAARRLKRLRSELERDRAAVEALLKERYDQMPRLIQTCRSYLGDNQGALRQVSEARKNYQKASSLNEKTAADLLITDALRALYAEAEKSPDLKSNAAFAQLQSHLSEIEERIVERRELYGEEVDRYNRRLGRAPAKWIGRIGHVRPLPPFHAGR